MKDENISNICTGIQYGLGFGLAFGILIALYTISHNAEHWAGTDYETCVVACSDMPHARPTEKIDCIDVCQNTFKGSQNSSHLPVSSEHPNTIGNCLEKIIYYLPVNYSGTIDMWVNIEDGCYDLAKDPEGIKDYVHNIIETHPDDWAQHMDWSATKYDPVVEFREDENVTEPVRVDIFKVRD